MLTTEEAARRLGVKVPTLYAYVSRGLLESHPDPSRRGSLFDLDEIEGLAARSRGGRQTATRLATITTAVTQLDQQLGPIYRGPRRHRPGVDGQLRGGRRAPVAVRGNGGLARARPRAVPADPHARAHALGAGHVRGHRSPPFRPPSRRGRPRHPSRHRRADRRRRAEARGGRPGCLHRGARSPLASPRRPSRCRTAAVNAALILMADHELATSTMAVRVAASVRSDPYDALLAGLATLAGSAARRCEPAGLRAAGRGRARRRAACAERRACRAGPAPRLRARRLQERRRPLRRVAGPGRASLERGAPRHPRTRSLRWPPRTMCRWPIVTSPSPR